MLYTRKFLLYVTALLASLMLTGCANLFVSDSSVVTDNRSTRDIWNDNNIEFEAAALGNKPPFAGKVRVAANSYRGKVVLIGQAPTAELNQAIEKRVTDIPGVNKVYNQLRIQPTIDFAQMSQDSWITTKVKSALISEKKLNGISIKVVTENREVFLFGYVSPQSADIATNTARNVGSVKLVIRGFEIASPAVTTDNPANSVPVAAADVSAPIEDTAVETNTVGNQTTSNTQDALSEETATVDAVEDDNVMGGDVLIDRSNDIVEEPIAD
ncbi:BON domain-containing protein [Vibrio sp. UCD-FRSSP16_10]|uniref:BON domain-containing protein n=1 Tax=unclassified Vibrio TaxID=2614977 RepID=UPI0007FB8D9C|nr:MULTISPECIES: BON domain-containing protein [unclassified Vibrio]OBT07352.1 BON domain-containing protein [Vibrio sp. UCD-FRSSP16_30]OBT12831.1 BON domain-containing protein [Vibrio sp. UCD-FRSSP16_10]